MAKNAFTVKITGADLVASQLEKYNDKGLIAIRKALQSQLNSWLMDAKLLTPVDTSALQQSGRVNARSRDIKKFQIIFGGVTRKGKFVNYAEEVHENHPTGAKFLERVVDARSPGLEQILANAVETVANSL